MYVYEGEIVRFPMVFGKILLGIPRPQEGHGNTVIGVIFRFFGLLHVKNEWFCNF